MSDFDTPRIGGGPAFPRIAQIQDPNSIGHERPRFAEVKSSNGMELRDFFAAKAMQAFVSSQGWCFVPHSKAQSINQATVADMVCAAYQVADAMLAARSTQ